MSASVGLKPGATPGIEKNRLGLRPRLQEVKCQGVTLSLRETVPATRKPKSLTGSSA
jgi:hypothetical protein